LKIVSPREQRSERIPERAKHSFAYDPGGKKEINFLSGRPKGANIELGRKG